MVFKNKEQSYINANSKILAAASYTDRTKKEIFKIGAN